MNIDKDTTFIYNIQEKVNVRITNILVNKHGLVSK
jgi:hypothetical protein